VSPSKFSSVCSSCQQGKSHHFHFSYSPSISSSPLQLLFLDVWGPASITSVNNKSFYFSIVNDFSKYTWFFPLATKSEVCATFLHFKQLVETFFSTKIISIQSDNGGEFRPLQTAHWIGFWSNTVVTLFLLLFMVDLYLKVIFSDTNHVSST